MILRVKENEEIKLNQSIFLNSSLSLVVRWLTWYNKTVLENGRIQVDYRSRSSMRYESYNLDLD